ncbi:MAG: folate-binding protein [Comamonadaceae bacterium]|nr:MAG: folate-binding protein [Comamonadaceae bacterium]
MQTSAQTSLPSPVLSAVSLSGLSGSAELTDFGVIRAAGEDAVKFLQGQLTQDVALMGLSEARLAAFCNAKGRMQASFIVFRRNDQELLLVCSRDILPATLKRLSMFVLRAKVKMSDATAEFRLLGLAGSTADDLTAGLSLWSKTDSGDASIVVLHPAKMAGTPVSRALWCAPVAIPAPDAPALELSTWSWLGVQSGIAMVTQPIFEAFVPQMLNYESVGGVNFKKGCYPGQEIVARSQFRGTLKRRAYVVSGGAGAPAAVGQEVFHSSDESQPCGTVAAAAVAPDAAAGFAAIVSMQTSAALDGELRLGSATGPLLALQPLPYALLEDI